MAKKALTKKALMDQIQLKIQELNLLQSALKGERSTRQETLGDYQKKFKDLLEK